MLPYVTYVLGSFLLWQNQSCSEHKDDSTNQHGQFIFVLNTVASIYFCHGILDFNHIYFNIMLICKKNFVSETPSDYLRNRNAFPKTPLYYLMREF